jgi:hypothetical protein
VNIEKLESYFDKIYKDNSYSDLFKGKIEGHVEIIKFLMLKVIELEDRIDELQSSAERHK